MKHGTINTYKKYGCRCDECRAKSAQAKRDERLRKRNGPIEESLHGLVDTYRTLGCRCQACKNANFAELDKENHGTLGKYRRGCRCDECRSVNTELARFDREKRQGLTVPDHFHGKMYAYTHYGCRCEACKAVKRAANKAAILQRTMREAA